MKKLGTKGMITGALFVSISVVLARFFGIMILGGSIRLSFANVPIILGGMVLGPVGGFVVGVLADLIGAILFPQGAFFPGFVLSSGLTGLIPALIIKSKKDFVWQKVLLSNILIFFIVSLILNTYWLTILLDKAFFILLPSRMVSSFILTITNTFFVYIICKRLPRN